MKYAAFNINFDSLGFDYGFPDSYRDPSFFAVAERFFSLAAKYDFKFSIFVIGKDLEKTENQEAVRRWAEQGHEIGSHSWSHRPNLGSLDIGGIRREVEQAHEIITRTVGYEPKGFIAPAWSSSTRLIRVLLDLNYEYDTSQFPSWLMYPMSLKIWLNRRKKGRVEWGILHPGNFIAPLVGKRKPFFRMEDLDSDMPGSEEINKITILPLPTTSLRFPCWHTLAFILGEPWHKLILRACLKQVDAFYYLMHPADLIGPQDLSHHHSCYFTRMDRTLEEKSLVLEDCIRLIANSGRKIVTMRELASKSSLRLASSSL